MAALPALFAPTVTWAQLATVETGVATRLPFGVVPSFSATETFTRNDALNPGTQRSELVTQLSPAISITSNSARVKGSLTYALNTLSHLRDSSQNDVQQSLAGAVKVEAIRNLAFVDANATISTQPASPFGQLFTDPALASSNRAEVRTYSVSPYLRGSFAGQVDYEARLNHTASSSSASSVSGSSSSSALARLSGDLARLHWSLLAERDTFNFNAGRTNESDRIDASLSLAATSQLTLTVHGGREADNYSTLKVTSNPTYGAGLDWRPSEVTSLSAYAEHRSFGNTHQLNFSHRSGRTIWSYSDSRNVSTGSGQPLSVSVGTNYDLFYGLSKQADPVLRDQEVRALLAQNGLSPNAAATLGFLTSALTLDRQQVASAALQGIRDTLTFSFTRSDASHIDRVNAVPDALAGSSRIRQQSFSLSLAHRLTPTAALTLTGLQQRSSGIDALSGAVTASRLSSIDVSWSDQIGRHTRAVVTAHRGVFKSNAAPYTETAVTAGVNFTF